MLFVACLCHLQETQAGSYMPQHPQKMFCDSDYGKCVSCQFSILLNLFKPYYNNSIKYRSSRISHKLCVKVDLDGSKNHVTASYIT